MLVFKCFRHVNLVKIARVENLTGRDHGISSCKNHSGNGTNGTFLTAALGNLLEFQAIIRRIILTGAKTILSVRARGYSYLCLTDDSNTD